MTQHQPLFTAYRVGALNLPHRIVMAPMTRARSTQPGDVPNEMMARYYAQRANAAMIVTEATQITPQGKGYSFTPGLHSDAQVAGWRLVTEAVHRAGGRIVAQLWHVGRMSHESFHADGKPVAPSAIASGAQVWVVGADGIGRMVDCTPPRELSITEIRGIVRDFRRAAANAMAAGFDGVEIHGANGYLIDQFLRRSSNQRGDAYGGPTANRVRFLDEVATAVAAEVGGERVGMRMAPHITARGMDDSEMNDTMLEAARRLERVGVAYIHLAEADWDDAPTVPEMFRHDLRAAFSGTIMVAGGYDARRAEAIVSAGLADLVAMGRPFIANPDLPERLRLGLPLTGFDRGTLFGGSEEGYTSYARAA